MEIQLSLQGDQKAGKNLDKRKTKCKRQQKRPKEVLNASYTLLANPTSNLSKRYNYICYF